MPSDWRYRAELLALSQGIWWPEDGQARRLKELEKENARLRRVCRVLGQHRSTLRKAPHGADDEAALTEDIIALARQYGRYGYRRVTGLVARCRLACKPQAGGAHLAALAELFVNRGPPAHIRSDSGPEFIANAVQEWLAKVGVKTLYITPGSALGYRPPAPETATPPWPRRQSCTNNQYQPLKGRRS